MMKMSWLSKKKSWERPALQNIDGQTRRMKKNMIEEEN